MLALPKISLQKLRSVIELKKLQLLELQNCLKNETMEREFLAVHKGENFPQRIITCEFCKFPLPAVDLLEHQELCGNRTELCNLCSRYIKLRERISHESRCNGVPNILVNLPGVLILFLQNEVKGSTLTYLKMKIMRS